MKPELEEFVYACPDCLGGRQQLRHISYATWFRDQLITVPNFPAWVCDLCGRRDYDPQAVSWLNTLLHSENRRQAPRPGVRPGAPPGSL